MEKKRQDFEEINELNNNIMRMYKDLKKKLAEQKEGGVNEEIIQKMAEIHRKTAELEAEIDMKCPNVRFDKEFVKKLEEGGNSLEYYQAEYLKIFRMKDLKDLNAIREKSRFVVNELRKEI